MGGIGMFRRRRVLFSPPLIAVDNEKNAPSSAKTSSSEDNIRFEDATGPMEPQINDFDEEANVVELLAYAVAGMMCGCLIMKYSSTTRAL